MAGKRNIHRNNDGAGGGDFRHWTQKVEDDRDQLWEERVQGSINTIMRLIPGNIKTHRLEESFIEPLMSEIISHLLVNHNDHDELIRTRVDEFLNKNIDEILLELEQEKAEIAVREGVIKAYRDVLVKRLGNQYILARSFIGFLQRKDNGSLAGLIKEEESDINTFLSIVPIKEGEFEKDEIKLFLEKYNISKLYDEKKLASTELSDVLGDGVIEVKAGSVKHELTLDEKEIKLMFRDQIIEFVSLFNGDCRQNKIDEKQLFDMRWKIFTETRLPEIIPEEDPGSLKKISDLKTVLEKECGVYDSSIG